MARYMVEHNYVDVIGEIWMPSSTCAKRYELTRYDVDQIELIADERAGTIAGGTVQDDITREDIAEWLTTHSGDFQSVTDFCASIGDLEIEWEDLENAFIFYDCMHPDLYE